MGHLVGKDFIYQKLGEKINGLSMKAPYNKELFEVLKTLYSPEEAELIIKMPYCLSDFTRLKNTTKINADDLKQLLYSASSKGLVMDLWLQGKYYYMPSPLIIGIFEFTMMRMKGNTESKKYAELFHNYLFSSNDFWQANCAKDIKIPPMRTLPYEESIDQKNHIEVLSYEKARDIIKSNQVFSISTCSCRHEKMHLGEKQCNYPLDTCSSFGMIAQMLIDHKFAVKVSKREMLDNLERSKELGLVLNADNIKNKVNFICHCCKCCCTVFEGMRRFREHSILKTSNFLAKVNIDACVGCGQCSISCPINAITVKNHKAHIDKKICLGCGVCASRCRFNAVKLIKRTQQVLYPETTFERIVLQSLERGTLQNQIFDNMQSLSHQFMRGFLGAFLKLNPVKQALLGDSFRSVFLASAKSWYKMTGRHWMTKI